MVTDQSTEKSEVGTDLHTVKVRWELTYTLEERGGTSKEQLVLHLRWMTALGDAGLDVVCLHPFGEPLHVAVAVEGVRTQCPGYKNKYEGHKIMLMQIAERAKSS